MKSAPSSLELKRLQLQSVGYLLIRSAALFNERGIRLVNQGKPGFVFREAHTRLVPHLLEPEGVRISDLAKRLSVTKQAIQVLVAELNEAGIVRLATDPEDGRARRVMLTARGARAIEHGTGLLLEIEAELALALGSGRMRVLGNLLRGLLSTLEASPAGELEAPPGPGRDRRGSPAARSAARRKADGSATARRGQVAAPGNK